MSMPIRRENRLTETNNISAEQFLRIKEALSSMTLAEVRKLVSEFDAWSALQTKNDVNNSSRDTSKELDLITKKMMLR